MRHAMHSPIIPILALALAPLAAFGQARPDAVRYDANSLIIDGKPFQVYSGAFHYFRCPKPLWRERFQKIKEAGFNTVETYVAWNEHERRKPAGGVKDFSQVDMTDLVEWMTMAHEEFGLYTIIRPGPYICAEWQAAGYPRWLLAEVPEKVAKDRPIWLRSDDPSYLDWSQHWMDAVCKVVAPLQVTRKPAGAKGVILFQIENEYDFWGMPRDAKITHLKRLKKDARAAGIEVPIFTCLTGETRGSKDPELAEVIDVVNLYNRNDILGAGAKMADFKRSQPGKPGGVGELQGGWFAKVGGGRLSEEQDGIDELQINAITLSAFANGATITNYYMLFGGSHFGPTGARGQLTSYDYNAPIRETGAVGPRYAAVKGIGAMLAKWGETLASSDKVKITGVTGGDGLEFTVRAAKTGERLVFAFNKDRKAGKTGEATLALDGGVSLKVNYDLGPFGYEICKLAPGETSTVGKEWLPTPGALPKRPDPASLPKPIRVASALVFEENAPASGWKTLPKDGAHLATLGVFDDFPVAYATKITLSPAEAKNFTGLALTLFNDDRAVARVNGTVLATNHNASKPGRGKTAKLDFDVASLLKPGANLIEIFHEDLDSHNWDYETQDFYGLKSARLTRQAPGRDLLDWSVRLVADEAEGRKLAATADDGKGAKFSFDAATLSELNGVHQPGADTTKLAAAKILFDKMGVALYRTTLDLPPADLKAGLTRLVLERLDDKGEIFLNGQPIGKHNDWKTPFVADVAKLLRPGKNELAVVVLNSDGQGGLTRSARLESASDAFNKDLALSWARTPAGLVPASGGRRLALDTTKVVPDRGTAHPKGKPSALLTRYVAEFDLPAAPAGVRLPWHARLDASGNGQLYLNGHHVGRYFQAGPQRAFFLPSCWLKHGAKNTLVIEQLPTAAGAELRALEITPAVDHAELLR